MTENRWVTLCYLRHYVPTLKMLSCSLSEPGSVDDLHPNTLDQGLNRSGSIRVCTRAAVGFAYNGMYVLLVLGDCVHIIQKLPL